MDGDAVPDAPGSLPRQFSDPTISLFRAEDRVFDAMVDGWKAQMLARNLTASTVSQAERQIRAFQNYVNDYPWTWSPGDAEEYLAHRRSGSRPVALSTARGEASAIQRFCAYITNRAYNWSEFCERQFGDVPSQILFDWNMPRHSAEDAPAPGRRSFTKGELQVLFDRLDDVVEAEYAVGSKRWLPALRDSVAFKVAYAYGLRRRELSLLDLEDFGPNPAQPQYGPFGTVRVRWAKGTRGSGPRQRTVLTVPEFEWVVPLLEDWTERRRHAFATSQRSSALWPTYKAHRVSLNALSDSFADARSRAELPAHLGLHCLRHSYVTHLIESGYDAAFVQLQVGHTHSSTTGIYTSVSSDFKQKTINRMLAQRINELSGGTTNA